MKALVEEVNSVQKRIKVELSQEDVRSAFDGVYKKLRQKVKIKGFRPGKAPVNIIKKFYGNSVAADVVDQLVNKHLFSAIKDQNIQPIAAPVLETAELPEDNEPYQFSAVVDVMPQLKIDGYKGMSLSFAAANVDDSFVQREMEVQQRQRASTKQVEDSEAVCAAGMVATLSQTATLEGQPFGPFTFENTPIDLGKGHLIEEVESQVMGLKVGDKKSYELSIPDTFQDKEFVGKMLSCEISVIGLQELILPEINDEFAKDLGLESVDQLKTNITESLEKKAEQAKRNQLESSILIQLSEKNSFEVPPSMVDQVIDGMFNEFQFSSEEERKEAKADPERRKDLLDSAKQRTKNTLILSEVIKAEALEVSEDDIDVHVRELMSSHQPGQQIDQKILESVKASMGGQAKESLLFKKAIDMILEEATITEVTANSPK